MVNIFCFILGAFIGSAITFITLAIFIVGARGGKNE